MDFLDLSTNSDSKLVDEWHPDQNDSPIPTNTKLNTKVWWRHWHQASHSWHEWEATLGNRLKGSGCPYCSGKKVLAGFNDLATTNPALSKEWHPFKNGGVTPEDVVAGSIKKAWWLCEKGHEWEARISHRNNGSGCPYCAGQRAIPGETDLATVNPGLAAEWHPSLNGKLTPKDVTANSGKKVWWRCEHGHEWEASVSNRNGKQQACPYCSGRKVIPGETDLASINPALSEEWNGAKNGSLKPTMVTAYSNRKVWWQCRICGHEWQAYVSNRSKGTGCPKCSSEFRTSFPEQAILFEIGKLTEAKGRVKIGSDEVDVYLPDLNVGIEYDGIYWHRHKRERDRKKVERLKSELTRLFRVMEVKKKDYFFTNGTLILCSYDQKHTEDAIAYIAKCLGFGESAFDLAGDNLAIYQNYVRSTREESLAAKRPELAAEWHPAKNGQLKPNAVSPGSNKRIWWLGACGHEWAAPVSSRAIGNGCPYCSGRKVLAGFNDLATINPALSEEWHPYKNGELTPRDVTSNSGKKVWWLCEKGHEWEARISHRNNGSGCPYCAGQRAIPGETDLATVNPGLAAEWHPSLNGKLTPKDVTANSGKKVWWRCEHGHEWSAAVSDRGPGTGCPYCSGNKVLEGYNDLSTTNPHLANEWHPYKNGELTSRHVTANSGLKVWWLCEMGHEWIAEISSRNRGNGCPYCSGRYAIAGETDLATTNPDLAAEWHPTKNGNLTPGDVSAGSNKRVWWLCKQGHEWKAVIEHRSKRGNGCPYCSGRYAIAGETDLATTNPDLAAEWHPTKNGNLTPGDVSAGSNKRVWWLCPICGFEWEADVGHRNAGTSCPKCARKAAQPKPKDGESLLERNPLLAAEWHPTKNGSLTPGDVFAGSGKKVWWQHESTLDGSVHEWEATVAKRNTNKQGCPYCANKKALPGFNDLATKNPDLAAEWHPAKNGKLTPQDVTAGTHKRVWWLCPECGHEWEAPVVKRNLGRGCPLCARKR